MGAVSPFHTKCQTTGIEASQQAPMQKAVNDLVVFIISGCYVTSSVSLSLCGPASLFPVTHLNCSAVYNVRDYKQNSCFVMCLYVFCCPGVRVFFFFFKLQIVRGN